MWKIYVLCLVDSISTCKIKIDGVKDGYLRFLKISVPSEANLFDFLFSKKIKKSTPKIHCENILVSIKNLIQNSFFITAQQKGKKRVHANSLNNFRPPVE